MQDNKGYWNVGLSGICTVKCDEMGRPDKCCAKCQYWITGAPFIIGQVTEVNDLMYRIRAKAKKVKKLNMKYLEDFSDQVLGQIELLKEEVSTMISEWSLRYKYVNKSLELLNSSGENLPALITSEKVKLSIDKMDDFGIAFNICKYNELISEFDNTEAQFELEYFINKILINNSIEPFLFRLEREDSLKASNMFAKHILENYSYYHIEELIDGSMKLEGHDIKEIKFLIDNKLIEYKGV
jgi:DNA-directed RNA polymerase subunit F